MLSGMVQECDVSKGGLLLLWPLLLVSVVCAKRPPDQTKAGPMATINGRFHCILKVSLLSEATQSP